MGSRRTSDAVWSEQGTTPDAIEAALRELLVERHAENEALRAGARAEHDRVRRPRVDRGDRQPAARRRPLPRLAPGRALLRAAAASVSTRASRSPPKATPSPASSRCCARRSWWRSASATSTTSITIADPLVVTDLPTLLWSPHGHHDVVAGAAAARAGGARGLGRRARARAKRSTRARALAQRAYVVDLAWLRSTPWRERVAAAFDPPPARRELRRSSSVSVRHHPASTVAAHAAAGLAGLAAAAGVRRRWSRTARALAGNAHGARQDVALRLEPAPELQVRGLEGVRARDRRRAGSCDSTAAPAGLRARSRDRSGTEREWTIPGASRGEAGILGEGIRQALLRDPTYVARGSAQRRACCRDAADELPRRGGGRRARRRA